MKDLCKWLEDSKRAMKGHKIKSETNSYKVTLLSLIRQNKEIKYIIQYLVNLIDNYPEIVSLVKLEELFSKLKYWIKSN